MNSYIWCGGKDGCVDGSDCVDGSGCDGDVSGDEGVEGGGRLGRYSIASSHSESERTGRGLSSKAEEKGNATSLWLSVSISATVLIH